MDNINIILTEELLIQYVTDIFDDSNYGFKKNIFVVNKETYDALIPLLGKKAIGGGSNKKIKSK